MEVDNISRIGVIGAGLMGHGIALNFALSGYEVYLNDKTPDKLRAGIDNLHNSVITLQRLGIVTEAEAVLIPARVHTNTSIVDTVANVDFVVEAVFEEIELKHKIFAQLDQFCPERTILSSNASSFMSSQIASVTNRPDKVVVANWWNPPCLIPLVEVVRGPQTSDHTIETTVALFRKIGKRPIVLQKESPGFVGNRLQFALLREAISIVQQGIVSPEDVDEVVRSGFGRRLSVAGPFEVFDVAGWDTISHIIDQLFPIIESSPNYPSLIADKVGSGDLGVKTGMGFYRWSEDSLKNFRNRMDQALSAIDGFYSE